MQESDNTLSTQPEEKPFKLKIEPMPPRPTAYDLRIAHEALIEELNRQVQNIQPITFTQQEITTMSADTNTEKQEAISKIAETAPNLIVAIFARHWLTTVLGLIALIPAFLTLIGVETSWWGGVVTAIATGAGLIFSKSVTAKE